MDSYPAHIRILLNGEKKIQSVTEHLDNVSAYCKSILTPVGLGTSGELVGILHDQGKFTKAFASYIQDAATGKAVKRGSVNHTFSGVRRVLLQYHKDEFLVPDDVYNNIACELIAAVIGSHHGQFDCIDENGSSGFAHRLETEIAYKESLENFRNYCADDEKIDFLFQNAKTEIKNFCKKTSTDDLNITLSFLYRLILSALIEADRSDTAYFMADIIEIDEKISEDFWENHLHLLERKIAAFPCDTALNKARRHISEEAGEFADKPTGIYRMNVPTGGGKTLASLRAALANAAFHKKKRIIFAVPLLSVLEQNAKVIRDAIEDDSAILEHHSNVIREDSNEEYLGNNELIMENWHAPIIITTLVQLLNTLFDGRTSCVRRMHSLIDSIVVIDEVQSVPKKMVSLFNKAINFLSDVCGCTVILCSATQPRFEKMEHQMHEAKDIIPYDKEVWNAFERTQIIDDTHPIMDMDGLAAFAEEKLQQNENVLVVCNTKAVARDLYNKLKNQGIHTVHLSTAMCMGHRIETMKKIRGLLAEHESFVCVSTQLMEAGVDLSFGCTVRLLAGLDNHIQIAGRCNRNGEYGKIGYSYCVCLAEEKLAMLPDIQEAQMAMRNLLIAFHENEKAFGSLHSDTAIAYFYDMLNRGAPKGKGDFFVKAYGTSIYSMLTANQQFTEKSRTKANYIFNQAFKTAGDCFCVFEELTEDILVPYGDGKNIISDFQSERAKFDIAYKKELLKKSKPYTVAIYKWQRKKLEEENALYPICEGTVLALAPDFYHADIGVNEKKEMEFMEI